MSFVSRTTPALHVARSQVLCTHVGQRFETAFFGHHERWRLIEPRSIDRPQPSQTQRSCSVAPSIGSPIAAGLSGVVGAAGEVSEAEHDTGHGVTCLACVVLKP